MLGKYIGMTVLIGIRLIGAFGLKVLPLSLVRLAGVIPLALGVYTPLFAGFSAWQYTGAYRVYSAWYIHTV